MRNFFLISNFKKNNEGYIIMRRAGIDANGSAHAAIHVAASLPKRHRGGASSISKGSLLIGSVLMALVFATIWWGLTYPSPARIVNHRNLDATKSPQRITTPPLQNDARVVERLLTPTPRHDEQQQQLLVVVLLSTDELETRHRCDAGAAVLIHAIASQPRHIRPPNLSSPTVIFLPPATAVTSDVAETRTAQVRHTLEMWHQVFLDRGNSTTATNPVTLWVPEEVLLDIAALARITNKYPSDTPTQQQDSTSIDEAPLMLKDLVGWVQQALRFANGITSAQWLIPLSSSKVTTDWTIAIDGLRIIRRIGAVEGDDDEISVMPRFHGFPYGYEGPAEGGFVSPLYGETHFIEGGLRKERLHANSIVAPRDSAAEAFASLRTIDVPHGSAGWSAPFDVVMGGIALLLQNLSGWTPRVASSKVIAESLTTSIVAASMLQCRNGSNAFTPSTPPTAGCTLYLSHRVRLTAPAERPHYVIGRCMTEGDRFSADDVRIMNDDHRIDELWVPAPFLVDALRRSGVKQSRRITVIPEPIDAAYYDAALHRTAAAAVYPSGERRFRFLSNFKWEPRKGWDVLLWAYFTAFTQADPVELVLKTYLYMDPKPRDIGRIQTRILGFVRTMLTVRRQQGKDERIIDIDKIDWGWVVANFPKISIVSEEIDAAAMPAFYAAHDAFVLPSRGEGWGLPLQEAMSVGLPCIATAWSGMLGFMNHDNSFLIGVSETEIATDNAAQFEKHHIPKLVRRWEKGSSDFSHPHDNVGRSCHRVFDGNHQRQDLQFLRAHIFGVALADDNVSLALEASLRCTSASQQQSSRTDAEPHWAVPDANHLVTALRKVFNDPNEASAVGTRGRLSIMSLFTRDSVADVVTKRLLAIGRL
ncbi:glycosyltransferase, putative [Bodo saltans]|uniref:Glycosyltransferase, putative n=1 Tax=Bodo saltans TaxID=75058 RepID=A0A0S4IVQ4_BODSA|nr:glycosyltransferase, putative [Bodo saltans]|eukprot:CUF63681.1 glycosyltransferase, putative [Bodo saltans]